MSLCIAHSSQASIAWKPRAGDFVKRTRLKKRKTKHVGGGAVPDGITDIFVPAIL